MGTLGLGNARRRTWSKTVRKTWFSSVIKGHVLHLFLLQRKAPGVLGGGLRCLALTRMSRRLLQRR